MQTKRRTSSTSDYLMWTFPSLYTLENAHAINNNPNTLKWTPRRWGYMYQTVAQTLNHFRRISPSKPDVYQARCCFKNESHSMWPNEPARYCFVLSVSNPVIIIESLWNSSCSTSIMLVTRRPANKRKPWILDKGMHTFATAYQLIFPWSCCWT